MKLGTSFVLALVVALTAAACNGRNDITGNSAVPPFGGGQQIVVDGSPLPPLFEHPNNGISCPSDAPRNVTLSSFEGRLDVNYNYNEKAAQTIARLYRWEHVTPQREDWVLYASDKIYDFEGAAGKRHFSFYPTAGPGRYYATVSYVVCGTETAQTKSNVHSVDAPAPDPLSVEAEPGPNDWPPKPSGRHGGKGGRH